MYNIAKKSMIINMGISLYKKVLDQIKLGPILIHLKRALKYFLWRNSSYSVGELTSL
jgi:hypothetical protein